MLLAGMITTVVCLSLLLATAIVRAMYRTDQWLSDEDNLVDGLTCLVAWAQLVLCLVALIASSTALRTYLG